MCGYPRPIKRPSPARLSNGQPGYLNGFCAILLWTISLCLVHVTRGFPVNSNSANGVSFPVFEVLEEAGPGTVIIDNLQNRLNLLPQANPKQQQQPQQPYAAIGNPSSPGIQGLEIRPNRFDGTLQLVVRDKHRGPDREQLCNTQYSRKTDLMAPCDITLVILHGDRQNPSYARITLRVLDVNDNTPTFSEGPTIELRVPEDAGDADVNAGSQHNGAYGSGGRTTERAVTLFPLPVAFDTDLPSNGVKFYRLTTPTGQEVDNSVLTLVNNHSESMSHGPYDSTFQTSYNPTLKIIGRLDREKVSEYRLHLLAVDGGVPQRTGTLTIHLVVTDVNDNAPRFRKPIYHQPSFAPTSELNDRSIVYEVLRIPETLTPLTSLVTLIAEDPDQGVNSQLTYRLKEHLSIGGGRDKMSTGSVGGLNPFGLTHSNGTVTLRVEHKLDADGPGGQSLTENNRPIFGQLNKIIVEAVDHGSPPLTGSITLAILVENVNDNRPDISIQFTYPVKIPGRYDQSETVVVGGLAENALVPSTIAHLTVTDGDVVSLSGIGTVSYADGVRCETNDTRFVLEQMESMSAHGVADPLSAASSHTSLSLYFYRMSAMKMVDRELAEWIYIQVTCVDQIRTETAGPYSFMSVNSYVPSVQLTGSIIVTLKVLDVNDNSPQFEKEIYQFTAFETPDKPSSYAYDLTPSEEQRSRIGQVHAIDQDTGNNRLVLYRLITNPHDAFHIDERTGELWRVGSLDREREAQLDVRIEARDKGDPEMSSTCLAKIKILDVNDHSPYWVTTSTSRAIEGKPYSFGKSEDGVFYFSIYENLDVGSVIGAVKAIDLDGTIEQDLVSLPLLVADSPFRSEDETSLSSTNQLESDAKVVYQFEGVEDARLFSINWHTGEIRLNQKLDREARAHYELRVFAIDNPPSKWSQASTHISATGYWDRIRKRRFTATATVIITVLDVNDNAPQFDAPLMGQEFHLEPGSVMTAPGTTLFTAKAHDSDAGENATVRYMLEGGGYDLVEIDPTTGVCYLRDSVQPQKLLTVINHYKLQFSERVLTSRTGSMAAADKTDGQPNELKSLSLMLTIVAHDMGRPHQLNTTRTVRLVWNGGDPMNGELSSPYARGGLAGKSYDAGLLVGGKLSYSERLLIPLIVGAFLLLFIICLVLFGIFRYRRQAKQRELDDIGRGQLQNQPGSRPRDTKRPLWISCLSGPQDEVKESRDARVTTEVYASRSAAKRQDSFISNPSLQYKTTNQWGRDCRTSMDVPLPTTYKSYLPDCIPNSEIGMGEALQQTQSGKMNSKLKMLPNVAPSGYRPRYAGGRLSRAFSEESLSISRPAELGYTALCAYPSANPEQTAFVAGYHHRPTIPTPYYTTQKQRADQLYFSPCTNRRNRQPAVNVSAFSPRNPVAVESQAVYNPLSVATTCHVTYPTFQPIQPYDDSGQRYEEFELGPDMKTPSESGNATHAGSGWKAKVSDAYAENTFV